jgi:hypothetical protein
MDQTPDYVETLKQAKSLLQLTHDYSMVAVLRDDDEYLAELQSCISKLTSLIENQ